MPKKNAKGKPKRRTNNPKKRVMQDFREFKVRLKRMIDKTNLVWEGEPYAEGSVYRFVLHESIVNFVVGVAIRAQDSEEARAQAATLQMAEAVRLASLPDPDENGPRKPTEETDAAFEKYLTDSEPEGIIEPDAEETETVEVEGDPEPGEQGAEEDPPGSP